MSNHDDSGPAFPCAPDKWVDMDGVWHMRQACGMSLRDYFAAAALTGLLACPTRRGAFGGYSRDAYRLSDAMLKARAERGEEGS